MYVPRRKPLLHQEPERKRSISERVLWIPSYEHVKTIKTLNHDKRMFVLCIVSTAGLTHANVNLQSSYLPDMCLRHHLRNVVTICSKIWEYPKKRRKGKNKIRQSGITPTSSWSKVPYFFFPWKRLQLLNHSISQKSVFFFSNTGKKKYSCIFFPRKRLHATHSTFLSELI